MIGFSYGKRGSDKEEHAIEANRQGPTLGMRHGPAALRRTARTTKQAEISATAPPSQATQERRHANQNGSMGPPLGDLRKCATKWQVTARASLRATSTLLRNMSSNRFNIRRAVYRTLRALARDQSLSLIHI